MSDQQKPIHELLPELIKKAALEGRPGRFLGLLEVAESVKVPKGHEEIIQSIRDGFEDLNALLSNKCGEVAAKLTWEAADLAKKEIEKASADKSAEPSVTPGAGLPT